jgi:hypothetical protein
MKSLRLFLLSTVVSAFLAPLLPQGASAQPVPPPPPGPELRIRIAPAPPPPRRHEVILYDSRPSKQHQWLPGHWHHDGHDWTWNEGRWAAPPARRAHWIGPQYKKVRGGVRYVPGHWSTERVIYD